MNPRGVAAALLVLVAGLRLSLPLAAQAPARGGDRGRAPVPLETMLERMRKAASSPDGRDEAVEALGELRSWTPEHSRDPELLRLEERLAGWDFTFLPTDCPLREGVARLETSTSLFFGRPEPPVASFTVRRIDPEAYRAALLAAEPGEVPLPSPEAWVRGSEVHPTIIRSEGDPGGVLAFPARTGLHAIEERVRGFRKLQWVSVQRFGLIVRAVGRQALAYGFDRLTGAPRSGISLTVRSAEGTREATTGAGGLAFFELGSPATVIAREGDEVQACSIAPPAPRPERLLYLTTDRDLYAPGQRVHYKAILRERRGFHFSIPPAAGASAEIRGPRGDALASSERAAGEGGSFSGSLRLPGQGKPGTYRLVVRVEGEGGEPSKAEREIGVASGEPSSSRVGLEQLRAPPNRLDDRVPRIELATPKLVFERGEKISLRAAVRALTGRPLSGREVSFEVFLGAEECLPGLAPLPAITRRATTGARGISQIEFAVDRGARVHAVARVAGFTAEATRDFWVIGPEAAPWPHDEDLGGWRLELRRDRPFYRAGQKSRLLARSSGRPVPALFLLEGEDHLEARAVRLETGCDPIAFRIPEGSRSLLRAEICAVWDGHPVSAWEELPLVPPEGFLSVRPAANRPSYRPGEKITVSIETRAAGGPVAAEVEVGIVEASEIETAVDRTVDIGSFFRSGWPRPLQASSSTVGDVSPAPGTEWMLEESPPPARLTVNTGGFPSGREPPALRRVPETLFWSGRVMSGPAGLATIEVAAPRKSATWRITARALGGASRFGEGRSTFATRE